MGKGGSKAGFRAILKDFEIKKLSLLYKTNTVDSMLTCVCSVIDPRRQQNMVRTSVTHLAIASCATFLFSPHFDVICDLLLNRQTATWNLLVKETWHEICVLVALCKNCVPFFSLILSNN